MTNYEVWCIEPHGETREHATKITTRYYAIDAAEQYADEDESREAYFQTKPALIAVAVPESADVMYFHISARVEYTATEVEAP